jgi:DNA-binding transcriptional regulator LsrR (DeoR family)
MPAKPKRPKKSPDCLEPDLKVGRAKQRAPKDAAIELDIWELRSAVMKYLTKGHTNREILQLMEEEFGEAGRMNREQPIRHLRFVAKKGYVQYNPPHQLPLAQKIRNKFKWLKTVDVVLTTVAADVARAAARTLLELVQECHESNPERDEVHIGFAAGLSMRALAQSFAELLAFPGPDDLELPKRIVFHSMVSGHEPGNPTTSPNAFFSFFLFPPLLVVEPQFVGLHAPAIFRSHDISTLMETPEIAEAYGQVSDLDIIVTSGSDWDDPHSSLRRCMERSPESLKMLLDNGTLVDMMWRPLARKEPVEVETEIRALTLVELSDLPVFRRTKKVLLMLGPCAKCNRPKGRVLETILAQDKRLVTNIVIDSRTAREVVRAIEQGRL